MPAVLILYFWPATPFGALLWAATYFANRPVAASIISLGAIIVTPLVFYVIHESLKPLPPGARNCIGPIPLLLLPLCQLVCVGAIVVVACLGQATFSTLTRPKA
jgi:hypothetical protein